MASSKVITDLFKDPAFITQYRNAEKVTGAFAPPLVQQSGIATFQGSPVILDSACGTGIVASTLVSMLGDEVKQSWELTCGDLSQGMVEYTRHRARDQGWPNTEVKLVNAQDTKLPARHYTHIYAGFGFASFPDPEGAIKECSRILKPGGTIALSAWKNAFWGAIIKAALDTIPEDLPFPEGSGVLRLIHDEPWDSELFVRSQLEQGGFTDIHINVMSKQILMGVDEFLKVQDMMLPLVLSRCWTQELREKHEKRVPAVLRQYLEDKYGPDGSVVIEPVAIIATARKPW